MTGEDMGLDASVLVYQQLWSISQWPVPSQTLQFLLQTPPHLIPSKDQICMGTHRRVYIFYQVHTYSSSFFLCAWVLLQCMFCLLVMHVHILNGIKHGFTPQYNFMVLYMSMLCTACKCTRLVAMSIIAALLCHQKFALGCVCHDSVIMLNLATGSCCLQHHLSFKGCFISCQGNAGHSMVIELSAKMFCTSTVNCWFCCSQIILFLPLSISLL